MDKKIKKFSGCFAFFLIVILGFSRECFPCSESSLCSDVYHSIIKKGENDIIEVLREKEIFCQRIKWFNVMQKKDYLEIHDSLVFQSLFFIIKPDDAKYEAYRISKNVIRCSRWESVSGVGRIVFQVDILLDSDKNVVSVFDRKLIN